MMSLILSLLTSRLGGWIVGGLLLVLVGLGGKWYIGHLQSQNDLLTRQLTGYKRAVAILKQDLKTDQETEDDKIRIENLSPEQLPAEFERLRQRARSGNPADTN